MYQKKNIFNNANWFHQNNDSRRKLKNLKKISLPLYCSECIAESFLLIQNPLNAKKINILYAFHTPSKIDLQSRIKISIYKKNTNICFAEKRQIEINDIQLKLIICL